MALIRRAVAATLAALALAAAAAQPAQAYWRATGGGTGTVPTAGGAARAITLSLSTQGNRYAVSGTVGTTPASAFGTAPYTVTVVFCKNNTTWPCPSASVVTTLVITTSSTTYSGTTPTQTSFKGIKAYGMASQTQTSGWTDYSSVAGPVTP
jgi:hypothetical protein